MLESTHCQKWSFATKAAACFARTVGRQTSPVWRPKLYHSTSEGVDAVTPQILKVTHMPAKSQSQEHMMTPHKMVFRHASPTQACKYPMECMFAHRLLQLDVKRHETLWSPMRSAMQPSTSAIVHSCCPPHALAVSFLLPRIPSFRKPWVLEIIPQ